MAIPSPLGGEIARRSATVTLRRLGNPGDATWSQHDARLLTMVSGGGALSLGDLLLRCDGLVPVRSWESFVESMGRLVGADLVISSARRFVVTSEGRAISPGGVGRYFEDLFNETRAALIERVDRPEPAALGITQEEFDGALAYVAEVTELRRTRRGRSGYEKWAEWDEAPPLTFADCLEFLTFSEGREVVVAIRTAAESVSFAGRLGPPFPPSSAPNERGSVIFPLQARDTDAAPERVVLSPDVFTTAAFSSYDGVDYFTLEIRSDDGSVITVSDANT